MPHQIPSYIALHRSGELEKRILQAHKLLEQCTLCPRKCKVNRLAGETGFCKTAGKARVASYNAHFGEETPLVGSSGSGTIFFSYCNLGCVFCQNYSISHHGEGIDIDPGQLAAVMISLQKQGCHNINFVTPTHVVPQILAALPISIDKGLSIPLVYNSSGYDAVDTLRILDGIIDIYMPDFKFWNNQSSKKYSKAPDYPEMARKAITEMHRQVGDLKRDTQGIAVSGLLVRHLVMPGSLDETEQIMKFLASLSPEIYVNVMEQYRPCHKAHEYQQIARSLTPDEYKEALNAAHDAGLHRLEQDGVMRLLDKLHLLGD
ncbi:MAG: radical SAM protein [Desulfobulbaceae bacterium]|uniref:Radical SAM protein n=1 Tax=Candidatus Desulfobia pelagia TaxID=2841692 RepID=A0A8J6NIF5_9BACT|nr:radical SAM protein [Candidatus Desulfobia pelagia]